MIALDDNIEDHPKFVSLSNDAFALWVRCIGYCRRNLTDGFIPAAAAQARARCKDPRKPIAELTSPPVGQPDGEPLLMEVPGGYLATDYLRWNPNLEEVEEARASRRWSRANYRLVFERDNGACRYCGSTSDPTIDHVVPRVRGGGDEGENLVVACRRCNSRKGARTPEEAGMVLS